MNKKHLTVVHALIFIGLLIFTIALGINNVNSGTYADAHGLDGASVGWFAPMGVPLWGLSFLVTLADGLYVVGRLQDLKKK